jgi:DNA-binding MarR family transcriptional regulator
VFNEQTENHQSENRAFILNYLQKLGFSAEESQLYLALHQEGAMSLLEASRASGIERSKLYRTINTLVKRGVIEELPEYKRRKIQATDTSTIDMLLKQRELDTQMLNDSFPTFMTTMSSLSHPFPESRVVYYKGVEGIKQLVWNILRCNDPFHRTYSYCFWDDRLDPAFVLRLNQAMQDRRFKVHDIYSDQYIKYKNDWLAKGLPKPGGDWLFWESRYVPESVLTVNLNMEIYNDVVAYYYWQGDEIFGVEIYNERVAKFQKQMFDVLWKTAHTRKELDWREPWQAKL